MLFTQSLKKNFQFRYVYHKGRSFANRRLVMYIIKNGTAENRLGISVSKKVGNSVVRHHLTRLIRESYRLHEEMFQIGWDIVIVVRPAAKDISFHEMEGSVMHLANLHHILKQEKKMVLF